MPPVDFQRLVFDGEFRRHFREDFQRWFASLARLLHPGGELVEVRITQGDGGLDCVVINKQRVYACYAPTPESGGSRDSQTAAKMASDFQNACTRLGAALREWVFVHNHSQSELGKESATVLLQLKAANPKVTFWVWGINQLWDELSKLPAVVLSEAFGLPGTSRDLLDVDLADIQAVVKRLEAQEYDLQFTSPTLPSLRKLEFNGLSAAVQSALSGGRFIEPKVRKLIESSPTEVERGERIATAFRQRYVTLRGTEDDPDRVFDLLAEYAGWAASNSVRGKTAVLGVLSYFFERCDIFDNPPP